MATYSTNIDAPHDRPLLLWDSLGEVWCSASWQHSREAWIACGTEEAYFWVNFTAWAEMPSQPKDNQP